MTDASPRTMRRRYVIGAVVALLVVVLAHLVLTAVRGTTASGVCQGARYRLSTSVDRSAVRYHLVIDDVAENGVGWRVSTVGFTGTDPVAPEVHEMGTFVFDEEIGDLDDGASRTVRFRRMTSRHWCTATSSVGSRLLH